MIQLYLTPSPIKGPAPRGVLPPWTPHAASGGVPPEIPPLGGFPPIPPRRPRTYSYRVTSLPEAIYKSAIGSSKTLLRRRVSVSLNAVRGNRACGREDKICANTVFLSGVSILTINSAYPHVSTLHHEYSWCTGAFCAGIYFPPRRKDLRRSIELSLTPRLHSPWGQGDVSPCRVRDRVPRIPLKPGKDTHRRG